MSFFKDFKEDLLQAAEELISNEDEKEIVDGMEVEIETDEPDIADATDDSVEIVDEILEEVAEEENMIVGEEDKMEEKIVVEKEEKEIVENTAEVTTISKGVHLEGNLKAEGSVNLLGSVVGDLECAGKLVIDGTIKGNAKAAEIYANGARVEGDIISDGSLKVGSGSIIIGNIVAASAVIGGAIKGDIDVKGPVIVDSTAVVFGNIKSRSVQLNNGAVLEGFVSQCYAGVDVKALFEEKASKK